MFHTLCNYQFANRYNQKKNMGTTKNITVFLNGLRTEKHKVTLDSRRFNKWYHILNEITNKMDPYFGVVKKLYSSESGITICSFSELENNGTYVASDNRKFQDIKGGYKSGHEKCPFQHYVSGSLHRSNRIKKLTNVRCDLLVIYVFINGEENNPPEKFVLSREDLQHWEQTLSYMALIIDMPYRTIKALYAANGSKICGPWELQHGASYIAVGYHEKFLHRDYKIHESTTDWNCERDRNLKCSRKYKENSWDQNLQWKFCVNNLYNSLCAKNEQKTPQRNCPNIYRNNRPSSSSRSCSVYPQFYSLFSNTNLRENS